MREIETTINEACVHKDLILLFFTLIPNQKVLYLYTHASTETELFTL